VTMADQSRISENAAVGVECGQCGSPAVYFETCDVSGHDWAVASECQTCGDRYAISPCHDCSPSSSTLNLGDDLEDNLEER
jgi:hypothetical protein